MWTCEHVVASDATPAQVWALYAEPATWPEWDRATERVTLRGPFLPGSRGTLKPAGGPATRFTLVEVVPEVGFTSLTRLPLARLAFGHRIQPTPTGSRITHTVTISGPLAPLFARDLPAAVQALARLAAGPPAAPAP